MYKYVILSSIISLSNDETCIYYSRYLKFGMTTRSKVSYDLWCLFGVTICLVIVVCLANGPWQKSRSHLVKYPHDEIPAFYLVSWTNPHVFIDGTWYSTTSQPNYQMYGCLANLKYILIGYSSLLVEKIKYLRAIFNS
jgi:hypothetical protein